MDKKLIEGMRRMNQIGAWETYGKDAIAGVSNGIDCLYFDKNSFGFDRIYFNIMHRYDEVYTCLTDDVNLKPNEQQ